MITSEFAEMIFFFTTFSMCPDQISSNHRTGPSSRHLRSHWTIGDCYWHADWVRLYTDFKLVHMYVSNACDFDERGPGRQHKRIAEWPRPTLRRARAEPKSILKESWKCLFWSASAIRQGLIIHTYLMEFREREKGTWNVHCRFRSQAADLHEQLRARKIKSQRVVSSNFRYINCW